MLNSVLRDAAQQVMNRTSPAQFLVSAHFINKSVDAGFSFYPFSIDGIVIDQDYLENWTDAVDLTMTISPKDYALLQDQGQNLLCILTFTYVTKDGKMVFTPPPVQKQYHVIINNPRDVRKAIPDIQFYTEPSEQITVRLMEPASYALRHRRVNTVFHNATVLQAIYGATKHLGITKIEVVPPDNTHQYDHIDIPSYQGIEAVYQYFHSKYGVYEKACTSYVSGDVLYVYPPFETAPTYDKTAIFYQVDTGSYSGASIFHRVEGNTVSIVINKQAESYDLSVAGAENVGTGFMFTRASRSTDNYTQVSGDDVTYTEQTALTVKLGSARPAVEGVNNIRHVRTTDNPYPDMSEIMASQASLMKVPWMHADPFQLDPGHAIAYYYDLNEKMVKKTGILQRAQFGIMPMPKTGAMQMFGVSGILTLRLAPNATVVL